jgi:DNA-binding response OmpR family regulator
MLPKRPAGNLPTFALPASTAEIPMIMITAKAEEADRVVGLMARRLSRRPVPRKWSRVSSFSGVWCQAKEVQYEYGELPDLSKHEVSFKGKTIPHGQRVQTAEYFTSRVGLSRDMLLNEIRGYD